MWREIDFVIKEKDHFMDDYQDLHIEAKVSVVHDSFDAHNEAGDLATYSAPSIDIEIVRVMNVAGNIAYAVTQEELQKKPRLAKFIAGEINRIVENMRFDS